MRRPRARGRWLARIEGTPLPRFSAPEIYGAVAIGSLIGLLVVLRWLLR